MVRKRHRYVTLDVTKDGGWSKGSATRSGLMYQALMTSIKTLYGIQGIALAKTGLNFEFMGSETNLARVTMRRSAYKIVTSALQLITIVDGGRVAVRSLHTAATIRHANLFCQKYLRRLVEQQIAEATPAEQQKLKLAIKDRNQIKRKRPVTDDSAATSAKKLKLQRKQEKLKLLHRILNE